MEPFSPEDPVSRLLGKARQAEPRPNFTQNVLRAVRQLPQQESAWERMRDVLSQWFAPRPGLAGVACALVAVTMAGVFFLKPAPLGGNHENGGVTVAVNGSGTTSTKGGTDETDVVSELDQMDQFSQLLAQQDTHSLSDSDLAALLY